MSSEAGMVLVVEDELPIRRFLRPALQDAGYRLIEADTVASGLAQAASQNPEVLIVDLGLPDGDGLELIERVREWSSAPIVVLTARDREDDKIRALDLGADDYLTKPFSVPELLARLRVAFRHRARSESGETATNVVVGELSIDLARRRVKLEGEPISLTPVEYRLLVMLARAPGRVFTHRALLRDVWGPGRDEAHLVRVHVANLRRKLERDPGRPRFLLTEPGVGYRLADD
jgi:two-component system KDP operon response regulator KdpE